VLWCCPHRAGPVLCRSEASRERCLAFGHIDDLLERVAATGRSVSTGSAPRTWVEPSNGMRRRVGEVRPNVGWEPRRRWMPYHQVAWSGRLCLWVADPILRDSHGCARADRRGRRPRAGRHGFLAGRREALREVLDGGVTRGSAPRPKRRARARSRGGPSDCRSMPSRSSPEGVILVGTGESAGHRIPSTFRAGALLPLRPARVGGARGGDRTAIGVARAARA
jgi:hypothetical protein